MLTVHILPGDPEIISGTKDGRDYRIVKQAAAAKLASGATAAFTVQPRKGQQPYAAGTYALAAESFFVKDGSLAFSPVLVAVNASAGESTNAARR